MAFIMNASVAQAQRTVNPAQSTVNFETAGNELETCYVATPEHRTHPIKKEVNNLLSMLLSLSHTHTHTHTHTPSKNFKTNWVVLA